MFGETAAIACCSANSPVTVPGGAGSGSGGGLRVGGPGAQPQGLLQRIAAALDQGAHGDGSAGDYAAAMQSQGLAIGANRSNVVPFPMVNPFKPALKTRSPITGLNRFPNRFTYSVPNTESEPDDEQSSFSGLSGLGYTWGDFDPGFPSSEGPIRTASGGGTLQTIIGGIEATLPATIQALRASPSNIFPSRSYDAYAPGYDAGGGYGQRNAGASIGAQTGAAVGNVGDTIGNIVRQHPLLVLAGGAALVLLFMNPPRRR